MNQLEKTRSNVVENVLKKTRSLVALAPSKNIQLQHRKTHVYLYLDLDQTNAIGREKPL
jgi:lactam utilization protein B